MKPSEKTTRLARGFVILVCPSHLSPVTHSEGVLGSRELQGVPRATRDPAVSWPQS